MAQVVLDSAGITHPACGDDHRPGLDLIERHRLLDFPNESDGRLVGMPPVPGDQVARRSIEQIHVLQRQGRRRLGHGRINMYRHGRQPAAPYQVGQDEQDLLGPAYRKGRQNDIAVLARQRVLERVDQFILRVGHVLVQPVAVGGLDNQDVSLGYGCGVIENRPVGLTKVS